MEIPRYIIRIIQSDLSFINVKSIPLQRSTWFYIQYFEKFFKKDILNEPGILVLTKLRKKLTQFISYSDTSKQSIKVLYYISTLLFLYILKLNQY